MDTDPKPAAEPSTIGILWVVSESGPCVNCEGEVGAGPIGFKIDEPAGPLCDGCLLEGNKDLGMMMLMAHVVRDLATEAKKNEIGKVGDPFEADQIMLNLMLFARMYNQGATWPGRPLAARRFVAELQARTEQIPVTTLLRQILGDRRP